MRQEQAYSLWRFVMSKIAAANNKDGRLELFGIDSGHGTLDGAKLAARVTALNRELIQQNFDRVLG